MTNERKKSQEELDREEDRSFLNSFIVVVIIAYTALIALMVFTT